MDYYVIIVCILILLSRISVAYFTCKQTCPDAHKCELNKLNETCLMMESGSCIPDEKTLKGKDIKPSIVKLTYKRKIWMISWEPPEDVDFRFNGFIITILTNSSKILNYYMKATEALTFGMDCSLEYNYVRHSTISEVCVQTLPKSSIIISEGVQECTPRQTELRTDLLPTTTHFPSFTDLLSTTKYSAYLGDGNQTTVIAALVVSAVVVVSVVLGVILYIYFKSKQIKGDNNSITDTANCPIHGGTSSYDAQITVPVSHQGQQDSSNILNGSPYINNTLQRGDCSSSLQTGGDQMEDLTPSDRKLFKINFGT